MDDQKQNDQLELTYNSSVPIQDVALEIKRKQWRIDESGRRGSRRSALLMRHDDDDDDINPKKNIVLSNSSNSSKKYLHKLFF